MSGRAVGRRQRKCPQCGSENIATISYGLPAWSPELEKELASKRVVLGGCCITGDDPDLRCNGCGHAWQSKRRRHSATD
jgi:hypothetical protein